MVRVLTINGHIFLCSPLINFSSLFFFLNYLNNHLHYFLYMSNNNQPQIIQATALPIHQSTNVSVINPNFNNTSPPVKYQLTFSYSKTIKLFTSIEAFFLIIYGFYYPYYFIQAIGPLIGFIGAKNFYKISSYTYFFYLCLSIFSKIILFIFTFQDHISHPMIFLLTLLSFLLDIWILKISYKFISILRDLTNNDIDNIRKMHLVAHYVYW